MLAIRFARVGRKNRAQFKVVLQQHTIAPGGRHVAILGSYDPASKVAILKADKIKEWIAKGAQASNSAYNLFVKEGIIEGKKKPIKMKRPVAKEVPAEEHANNVKDSATDVAPKVEATETKAEEVKAEETKEEVKTEESKVETVEAKTE